MEGSYVTIANDGLMAIDMKPGIDLTPTFTKIIAKQKREVLGNLTYAPNE